MIDFRDKFESLIVSGSANVKQYRSENSLGYIDESLNMLYTVFVAGYNEGFSDSETLFDLEQEVIH